MGEREPIEHLANYDMDLACHKEGSSGAARSGACLALELAASIVSAGSLVFLALLGIIALGTETLTF